MLCAGAAPWRARRRDGGQARVSLPPRSSSSPATPSVTTRSRTSARATCGSPCATTSNSTNSSLASLSPPAVCSQPNLRLALLKKGCHVEHRRTTWCHCRESGPSGLNFLRGEPQVSTRGFTGVQCGRGEGCNVTTKSRERSRLWPNGLQKNEAAGYGQVDCR